MPGGNAAGAGIPLLRGLSWLVLAPLRADVETVLILPSFGGRSDAPDQNGERRNDNNQRNSHDRPLSFGALRCRLGQQSGI